ncbi:rab-GTPase-TBC domain-containing protein [Phycomyces nitens]|nr:rab-GTPase-TBC domain-containing protein [Phycomyces nitens]
MPELDMIDDPFQKEDWVVEKMSMVVSTIDTGTDELSSDESVRNASRTFRQIFDVPSSERLVTYYSCAYNGRQGWLYISENYLGFHSFLLGIEAKTLIELKEIQDITKEKAKRSMFGDSLKVITKDKVEHIFTTLFKRDEVYDLLVQLTGQAMLRLLKNTGTDAPGASTTVLRGVQAPLPTISPKLPTPRNESGQLISPLKHDLAAQKRNQSFCLHFRLPLEERLVDALEADYTQKPTGPRISASKGEKRLETKCRGRIYLSETFLAYESQERLPHPQQHQPFCWFVLPLYTIKRVDRVSTGSYTTLSVITWHKMEHIFELDALRTPCELFCNALRNHLKTQIGAIKKLKQFMTTCESEQLLSQSNQLVDVDDPIGGLGMKFGYPGDARKSKDRSKLNLWRQYFQENGRNLTMMKLPTFGKLVRVGLPNRLRGEIWEACSGAMYSRFANQGLYEELLETYKGQTSVSTEEIEKDLNRSLPEYPGYQTKEGIDRLRRVLTAYSWRNPELGYCQAMNIVTSALLIYTTEEQAFWILNILVDSMCPGYYSTSMYGAMLDQIVFEQLVEQTMPILWDHFKKTDVQLSVACLLWFLSLYVNSMPLLFAFRVLDCLFVDGPKILFQIGLAVLKLNGEELLQTRDDSAFLDILKRFFTSLDTPLDPNSKHTKAKNLTKFNQVMLVAYREFSLVTDELVAEKRRQNQFKVIAGIESYTKRSAIRHLKDIGGFSKEDIPTIYDKFFGALYYAKPKGGKAETQMDVETFQNFLGSLAEWAKIKVSDGSVDSNLDRMLGASFIGRIFNHFNRDNNPGITFQDAVLGLSEILHSDLMSQIGLCFVLYDEDKDGLLRNKDIITMAKELFWLICHIKEETIAWDAVCSLIVHSYEQSEIAQGRQQNTPLLAHRLAELSMTDQTASLQERASQLNGLLSDPEAPKIELTLPCFRMVVLTNEALEMFFDHGFINSFQLVKSAADRQKSLGRELFESLFAGGRQLAKESPASYRPRLSPNPSPSTSQVTLSSPQHSQHSPSPSLTNLRLSTDEKRDDQDMSDEIDYLLTELGHLDV